jgi:hypothetical protein
VSDGIRLELAASGDGGYIIAAVPVTAEYTATARIGVGVYQQASKHPEEWKAWLWPDADAGWQPGPECEAVTRPDITLLLEALQARVPWWPPPVSLTAGSEFPPVAIGINWEMLQDLYVKPHPLIRDIDTTGLHYGIVELLDEAKAVHHLLDLLGVPHGYGMGARDIASRTLIAVCGTLTLKERLDRISGWHARETGPAGTVGDYCTEDGQLWPCDTRRMADGTYTEEGEDSG